ncbi:MAG: O-antigen ligase family protein [Desulfitobacteriaceae bacterium]
MISPRFYLAHKLQRLDRAEISAFTFFQPLIAALIPLCYTELGEKMLDYLVHILLYLYVFLLPFLPLSVGGLTIPVSGDTVLAAVFGVFSLNLFFPTARKRLLQAFRSARPGLLEIFLVLMSVIMLFSVSYAMERKLALSESVRFISYVLLYLMIKYDSSSLSFLKKLLASYLTSAALLCLIGIYQFFVQPEFLQQWVTAGGTIVRVPAAFGNPNSFGAYLVLVLFPVLMLAFTQRKHISGLVYSFLSLLLILNIIFTGSRNALLGLILGCLVLVFVYNWRVIMAFVLLAPALLLPQVSTRLHDVGNISQNMSRVRLWQTALKMIKDHPVWGVGNGNFVSYYDLYIAKYPELAWEDWKRYPVHNSYLKVQTELGIGGSVSLLGILISAWLTVRKTAKSVSDPALSSFFTGFLASIPAFYFMNFSDNILFVPKVASYFWLVLAVAASAQVQTTDLV